SDVYKRQGELCGIIGRYISKDRPKNSRYKIYNFPTGDILFPLHKFEPIDDTIILVEGILDALWMHQLGFKNTLATLTNNISYKQAEIVKKYAKKVIDMSDNDEMGKIASEMYKKRLRGLIIYDVKQFYPEGKKDPQECSKEEIEYMLNHKQNSVLKNIKKL
ncbi:MAG: toprim domain-containing protein, partial [Chitinispirillaceae bacterium]|nr:toprim domain-containing protein [Chitinispirillaceae bacterium]